MTDYLHALPSGYRIQEYELVRVLGSGGFGITYLGYDHHLDKAVAIKEYLPNDLAVRTDNQSVLPKSTQDQADYEWGLERFLNEAQTLARFDHRHIIKIHRFFRAHGTGYIVMEYAEGETLSELLQRKGTLTESELKAILFPILDGLEAVHEVDFLHRDIKPGNIVIRDEGSPVLIDFGSARQAVAGKSRSVTAIVTPGYAPIEQYSVKGHQGPWTDIYGLGAVCYRCLVGEPPNDATERLREDPLMPAAERCKGEASAASLDAIDRALQVNEGERPQNIAAWRQLLTDGGKSGTRAARPMTRSVGGSATARAGMSWLSMTLVAVIVVLLGASAWRGWQLYQDAPSNDAGETVTLVEQEEEVATDITQAGNEMKTAPGPVEQEMPVNDASKMVTEAEQQADVAMDATQARDEAETALETARAETGQQTLKQEESQPLEVRARELAGEMVDIPGGTFRMGDLSGEGRPTEKPVHTVTVPAFRLGKYEVTVGQFRRFVLATGYRTDAEWDTGNAQGCYTWEDLPNARSYTPGRKWQEVDKDGNVVTKAIFRGLTPGRSWRDLEYPIEENQPVVCVSWDDTQAFIQWLSEQTGKTYRLPTEAEWEYAARAGSETLYHFGDEVKRLCEFGNVADTTELPNGTGFTDRAECDDGAVFPTSVGSYRPNAFGLHDMHGNVWEWLEDCMNSNYNYMGAPGDGSAWTSGDCDQRAVRGGSWRGDPGTQRSASRNWLLLSASPPMDRWDLLGFRLAQDK